MYIKVAMFSSGRNTQMFALWRGTKWTKSWAQAMLNFIVVVGTIIPMILRPFLATKVQHSTNVTQWNHSFACTSAIAANKRNCTVGTSTDPQVYIAYLIIASIIAFFNFFYLITTIKYKHIINTYPPKKRQSQTESSPRKLLYSVILLLVTFFLTMFGIFQRGYTGFLAIFVDGYFGWTLSTAMFLTSLYFLATANHEF
jgi:hypothetical protein